MGKTLEREFAEYKEHHIYEMTVSALIMCEDEDIYNHPLLKDYVDLDLTGKEKAYYVADDLYCRTVNGDEKLYNKVYEMCWSRIVDRIDDKTSFRIGVNYDN